MSLVAHWDLVSSVDLGCVEQDGEGVPKPWKEDPWGLTLGQSCWIHCLGCFLHFKYTLVLLPLKL